jgi:hypothetical protein
MLVAGFICNFLVRPLGERWFMKPEEVAALQAKSHQDAAPTAGRGIGQWQLNATSVLAWLAVGMPIAWGIQRFRAVAVRGWCVLRRGCVEALTGREGNEARRRAAAGPHPIDLGRGAGRRAVLRARRAGRDRARIGGCQRRRGRHPGRRRQ